MHNGPPTPEAFDPRIAVATTVPPNISPHSPTERFDVTMMLPRS